MGIHKQQNMIIQYRQDDIFNGWDAEEINVLAHQCNCVSKYFAGFAQAIATKFPFMVSEHNAYIENNPNCFGTMLEKADNNKSIINIYSQYYPGSPNNKDFIQNGNYYKDNMVTRIDALKKCLKEIYDTWLVNHTNQLYLGIPLIASGLAADRNLKQDLTDLEYFINYIEPIITEIYKECDITIIIYHL